MTSETRGIASPWSGDEVGAVRVNEGVRYAIEEMTDRRTLVLPPPPA